MNKWISVPRVGRLLAATSLAVFTVALPACSDLFDVDDPQAFGDSDLNDPVILKSVADGAEGALQQIWDDFVVVTSLHGDEVESTSTWIDWEDISEGRLRADWATGGSFSGPQDGILRARFAAQSAKARFAKLTGVSPTLVAQVSWVDGFSDVLLGMGWCEGPLVENGPRAPSSAFFTQAITKLTATLALANGLSGADKTAWVNATLAARARANLFAGNYDAALADAQLVPAGFSKNAIYSAATGAQQSNMGNQFHQNRNRSGGLRQIRIPQVRGTFNATAVTTGYLRDWANPTVADTRMALSHRVGQKGVNNRFDYYGVTKYDDFGTDVPMLKKAEMTLIEAEVYYRKNNYATMTDRLNTLRAAANLTPIAVPANAADALNALLNERMAVLFVEGQRNFDLFRYNLKGAMLGAGKATLLPLSRNEILNNPNMVEGGGTCPTVTS